MKSHILISFNSNKIQTHYGLQGPVAWTLVSSSLTPHLSPDHILQPPAAPRPWLPPSPRVPTPCQDYPHPTLFFTTACFSAFTGCAVTSQRGLRTFCAKETPPSILPSAGGCLLLSLSYCNAHSPCRCHLPKQITWPHKAEPVSVLAATVPQGPQHFPASSGF